MPHTAPRADPITQYAALQERVHGLGQQFLHFEQTTNRGFQQVESAIATLSAEVRAGGKTQWQTIVTSVGVLVAILGALGTLAYMPIRNGMDGLAGESRLLRAAMVPRAEHMDRWRRAEEDLKALEADIRRNQDKIVPRGEHEEKWRSNERQMSELQRQLDEIRKLSIDSHSAKDALVSLGRRLERVEIPERAQRPAP